MANYPSQLKERDELNLRLGIKSSLSQLRSVIASLYVIYVANDKQAQVTYSQESIDGGLTSIKLEDKLAQQIDAKFPAAVGQVSSLVNKTPLFTAQLEALQVGIELFFHLAKVNFVTSGLSERTGSSRFQKKLSFATNMILIDLYLSSHSSEDVNKLLSAWLEDKPFASKLEDGLKMLLNTFTEETQYKIRNNNLDEIVFNQEGVYDTVLSEGEAISKDANEPVGPFRIYKSYIASGMHPYLIEQKQEFKLNGSVSRADLENYAQLVSTALDITPRKTTIEREVEPIRQDNAPTNKSAQIIYYGAPGTGKSYEINRQTIGKDVVRTTFHPDSDYSTFVGSYKPSMKPAANKQTILDYDSLVDKFKEYLSADTNITRACTQFGYDYHDSIVKMLDNNAHTIPALVADAYKSGTTYDTQVRSGMSVYETSYKGTVNDEKIIYSFIPQAFTKAYVRAWQTKDPVFLVIEELNRGNCAQIFGDIFQLLDRNENNESAYSIIPDHDLQQHLAGEFKDAEDIPSDIKKATAMRLPSNLYIWATMNTSDQSLFPMDSAFKRRWDWEYIPIKYSNSNWRIDIAGYKYSWVDFQAEINKRIFSATESEDKQLGDFFVKADDNNIISSKLLLNKVIFYLWNDVCKDGDGDIFKVNTDLDYSKELDPAKNEDVTFSKFFKETDLKLKQWMRYLNIKPLESQDDDDEEKEDESHQQEEGVKPNEAKPDTYSKPEYKSIVENMLPQLPNEGISIFRNGFDWSFSEMPGSYARMSLALDAPAKNKKATVKLWIPAPTGYSKSAECFAYLKDRDGEDIIRTTASKYGYEYEELGIHSKNPNPVVGWKITIPMTFAPENSQAESQKLLDILSEVRTAFDPIISDFLKK